MRFKFVIFQFERYYNIFDYLNCMNVFEVNFLSFCFLFLDDFWELGFDKLFVVKWIFFRDWKKGVFYINQIVIFIDLVNLFNVINCLCFWKFKKSIFKLNIILDR